MQAWLLRPLQRCAPPCAWRLRGYLSGAWGFSLLRLDNYTFVTTVSKPAVVSIPCRVPSLHTGASARVSYGRAS